MRHAAYAVRVPAFAVPTVPRALAPQALGCAMLQMMPQWAGSTIVRTRNLEELAKCDMVIDVGAVYDHATMRYDHHQRTMPPPHTTPRHTSPNNATRLLPPTPPSLTFTRHRAALPAGTTTTSAPSTPSSARSTLTSNPRPVWPASAAQAACLAETNRSLGQPEA